MSNGKCIEAAGRARETTHVRRINWFSRKRSCPLFDAMELKRNCVDDWWRRSLSVWFELWMNVVSEGDNNCAPSSIVCRRTRISISNQMIYYNLSFPSLFLFLNNGKKFSFFFFFFFPFRFYSLGCCMPSSGFLGNNAPYIHFSFRGCKWMNNEEVRKARQRTQRR